MTKREDIIFAVNDPWTLWRGPFMGSYPDRHSVGRGDSARPFSVYVALVNHDAEPPVIRSLVPGERPVLRKLDERI